MRRMLDAGTWVAMLHDDRKGRWKKGDKAKIQGFDVTTGEYVLLFHASGNGGAQAGDTARAYRNKTFAPAHPPKPGGAAKEPPHAASGKACSCRSGGTAAGRSEQLQQLLAGAIRQGVEYRAEMARLQAQYGELMAAYKDVQAMLTREAYRNDFEKQQPQLEDLTPEEDAALVSLLRTTKGSVLQRALYKALNLA